MSAKDNMQPKQLQMFMPAGHIRDNYPTVDADLEYYDTDSGEKMAREYNDQVMDDKVDRALRNGLRENIEARGIEKPVRLHRTVGGTPPPFGDGYLGNGGHRVATQDDLDPSVEVPVIHDEDFFDVDRYGNEYAGWGSREVRLKHGSE